MLLFNNNNSNDNDNNNNNNNNNNNKCNIPNEYSLNLSDGNSRPNA